MKCVVASTPILILFESFEQLGVDFWNLYINREDGVFLTGIYANVPLIDTLRPRVRHPRFLIKNFSANKAQEISEYH